MHPHARFTLLCIPLPAQVVAAELTAESASRKKRPGGRSKSSPASGAWLLPGSDRAESAYLRDEMDVHADLVYDSLEEGAHLHCCQSKDLEPLVTALLSDEARWRNEDVDAKIAEWRANGQWHTECMCQRAAENHDDQQA